MKKPIFYPCYPQGKTKAFTMSYDDGVVTDIRAVEIMRKHSIRATFNINSGLVADEPQPKDENCRNRLTMQECLDLYGDDMEIAIHGSCHAYWNKGVGALTMGEILDDRLALERATGKLIRGGAYPFGLFNDDVANLLRLAGIEYCRTTRDTKNIRMRVDDWVVYHPTCRHKDPDLMKYAAEFTEKENKTANLWLFYVWGHTYEFGEENNWYILENLLEKVGGRDDVWYATNIEIVDYVKSYGRLIYSADCDRVYNPTAMDLWLRAPSTGQVVQVPAGATVQLSV